MTEQVHKLGAMAFGDPGRKRYFEGTHRLNSPAETVARLRPLMGRMGITRIANVTGLDRIGLPVVMVCRPNSRSVAVAQGKGLDLAAATASGLMEAAETYHAERIQKPITNASMADLTAGHGVIDVDALPARGGRRFPENRTIPWLEGLDLLGDRPVWVPYEVVHADFTIPQPPGSGIFAANTNGLASGNHALEALCHGICEVIERDATALHFDLGRRAQDSARLDLDSVLDPACRSILHGVRQAGLSVAVWDTRGRTRIPSFLCVMWDERRPPSHPGDGAGCHPSPRIALLRAVLEAAQVRCTYIAAARDDLRAEDYGTAAIERKTRQAIRLAAGAGPGRRFGDCTGQEHQTFAEDLGFLLEELAASGARQVAAVDLTDPLFDLPVWRIVIPGLHPGEAAEEPAHRPRASAPANGVT